MSGCPPPLRCRRGRTIHPTQQPADAGFFTPVLSLSLSKAAASMMLSMHPFPSLQLETPLGNLLPLRVKIILLKNGFRTVEEVRRAYPDQLLKMRGMGMLRFRDIEGALFPGESFTPAMPRPPVRQIKGSSLNGVLSPATVQALARGGITTVEQLRAMNPKQLMRIDGFGAGKLRDIERVLLARERREP